MFIMVGRIITLVGTEYSWLKPLTCTISDSPSICESLTETFADSTIFIIADLLALITQAVGGGMASSADTNEAAERGARVMVGGIIVSARILPRLYLPSNAPTPSGPNGYVSMHRKRSLAFI